MTRGMLVLGWVVFAGVQLVMLAARVVGIFVLPWPCLLHAWRPAASRYGPPRQVDEWSWGWLNPWAGNWEDGVTGQLAKIWGSGAEEGTLVGYLPAGRWSARSRVVRWLHDSWRAYLWSAWRNSADNLKYFFAWEQGPFLEVGYSVLGRARVLKLGWQSETGVRVPVLSL